MLGVGLSRQKVKKSAMWAILISVSLSSLIVSSIALLFLVSYLGVVYGYVFQPNTLMNDYQGYFYYGGERAIWQTLDECVEFDKNLLYIPRLGRCEFRNTEFSSELNFDKYGRYRPPQVLQKSNSGVAVVGDSHSMGWGVDDTDTFSYILASTKNIPVYNLAVSSYGTYRELLRLENSGLLNKIDTIVIQYCENDISENVRFIDQKPSFSIEEFDNMLNVRKEGESWKIKEWIGVAFELAMQRIIDGKRQTSELDFRVHFEKFSKLISQFKWIKEKEVVVFFSNGHGQKFANFESFRIQWYPNIKFVEMDLNRGDYYILDDHLNAAGHSKIANKLNIVIN